MMACYKAANLRWPCYHHFRSLDIGANCSSHPPLQSPNKSSSEQPQLPLQQQQQQQQQQQTGQCSSVAEDGIALTGPCGAAASATEPVVCKRCKKYLNLLTVLRQTRDCSNGVAEGSGCCHRAGCCTSSKDQQSDVRVGNRDKSAGQHRCSLQCCGCCSCCSSNSQLSSSPPQRLEEPSRRQAAHCALM